MRLLAIAAAAILASASADAACLPYQPACVSIGPQGFVVGTDRFGPYDEGARRDLYIDRTAPPATERTAPRMRFDPYGRVIVAPNPRRPVPAVQEYLEETEEAAGFETDPSGAIARSGAAARSGVAAAPRVPSTPNAPADSPLQPSNGYYDGPRSQARY